MDTVSTPQSESTIEMVRADSPATPDEGRASPPGAPLDPKAFHRKLEAVLDTVEVHASTRDSIAQILAKLLVEFGKDFGVTSGRFYELDGGQYVVQRSFGAGGDRLLGVRVPRTYPLLKALQNSKALYFDESSPGYDPHIESSVGVRRFAAFTFGPDNRYLVSLGLCQDADRERILFALNTLRHAISHKIREQDLEDQILQAHAIQSSLLPERLPDFPGFAFAARSHPAESVGGDVYDFLELGDALLGVAVGDASGHGIAAALQARDLLVGLRMGSEKDFKIFRTIEKLNRVVHRSGLSSRFASLFYMELETDGHLIYTNAGHVPPILVRRVGHERLDVSGPILGPIENSTYRRSYARLEPGDLMLLPTDGLLERRSEEGEQFGVDRIVEVVRRLRAEPVDVVLDRLFDAAMAFGAFRPWEDDVTAVLVRRDV